MRFLIFGGAGFLGNRLVPKLRARGHEVIAPSSAEIDLREPLPADVHHDGVDVMIHMAALYGGMPFDMEHATDIYYTNSKINLNAFEYAKRIKPGQLVSIGSACCYPGYMRKDLEESDLFTGPLHESVVCHGLTKLAMVAAHQMYWSSHELAGTHLIPANLYGPGDVYSIERSHVVAALIRKYSDARNDGRDVRLLGDGSPVREFLYIDDLAEIVVAAAEQPPQGIRILNAGTGVGHSIRALAQMVSREIGYRGMTSWDSPQSNGAMRKVMRVDRLQTELGPFETLALEDGIKRTVEWYLPNKTAADARR